MSDMLLSAPVDREGHYTALSVNAGLIRIGSSGIEKGGLTAAPS
jgi:hypothetical protein